MKRVLALAVLFALNGSLGMAAEKKVTTSAPIAAGYKVDPASSKVQWTGKKVTGFHTGTVDVKSGELSVAQGNLVGGNVVIDMASIKDTDLTDAGMNAKLTGHLKSDDFFGVEKNPTATFKINSVTPAKGTDSNVQVTGDLTIKGITKPLTFPAMVTVSANGVQALAKDVKVDRTLYDVRYGSGKFFQGLGDKVIYDEFLLNIALVAKK